MKIQAYINQNHAVMPAKIYDALAESGQLKSGDTWTALVSDVDLEKLIDVVEEYGFPDGTEAGNKIADIIESIK